MNLLVVLSHDLTDTQIREAREILGVRNIIRLPEELRKIWSNIDPSGELPLESLEKIINWIKGSSEEGDYVLVQGDFGSTFYVVDFCFSAGRIPLYATTKRTVKEEKNGEQVHIIRVFEHVNFRRYVSFEGGS